MKVEWLGRLEYGAALLLQEEKVRLCDATGQEFLLLLEHEPVYTIGRRPDKSSLRVADRLPYAAVEINRGGEATYHGPGQLVGYPILDLRVRDRDLHVYLRSLESGLIAVANHYGLSAVRRAGLTGVWVEQRKLVSIGIGVRRWISMHGFALNVGRDLTGFDHIVPCGLAGVRMTSLSLETGQDLAVEEVAEATAGILTALLATPSGALNSA